jgi:hypothetical protein
MKYEIKAEQLEKIIEKQVEYISFLLEYFGVNHKGLKTKLMIQYESELASLKSQLPEQKELTDEDIEKWAEKTTLKDGVNPKDIKTKFDAVFLVKMIKEAKITGAKAHREGLIKAE